MDLGYSLASIGGKIKLIFVLCSLIGYLFYVCTFLCACMYVTPSVCLVFSDPEESIRSLGTGVESSMNHHVGAGKQPESSTRAASAFSYKTISLAFLIT